MGLSTSIPARPRMQFTELDDGLALDWFGHVFMNPPYGRALSHWFSKAKSEADKGVMVVGLVPARTDTAWWQDHAAPFASVVFLRGHLAFGGQKVSALFPFALPLWGVSPALFTRFRSQFSDATFAEAFVLF